MKSILLPYKLVDLIGEKYTERKGSYLELFAEHFHWHASFLADVPDDRSEDPHAQRNEFRSTDLFIKRDAIKCVGVAFMPASKLWQVYLECTGMNGYVTIFFRTNFKAQELAAQLTDYMCGRVEL
jgi:hypothetical protein